MSGGVDMCNLEKHFTKLHFIWFPKVIYNSFCEILKISTTSYCAKNFTFSQFSSIQSLSCVLLFVTPRQVSLSITNSQSLPKLMSIESVMPSNHLILLSFISFTHVIFSLYC